MRRRAGLAILAVACLPLAGCVGWSTAPAPITSSDATLHAQASCHAENDANPCTYWFQYWADGSATVLSTPPRNGNVNTNGTYYDVTETITGLTPNTLYRSQFCGYGDNAVAQPGACIGLHSSQLSQPGSRPGAGDLSATQNFRTAGTGTAATVDLGRPLSAADTATTRISRDAGLSAAWSDSQALWLFGDTVQKNGPPFLSGTTAAAGPYVRGQVPTALQELPTPPSPPASGRTSPALLLPVPQGLKLPSGDACGAGGKSYPASWPSGVTAIPGTATMLITYAEVCVISSTQMPVARFSLARYDPAAHRILGTATPFIASPFAAGVPPGERLGSPVFGADGFLYLYGNDVTTGRIIAARVPATPSSWGNRADYQWWNGAWQSNPAAATSVASVPFAGSVHVADYTGVGSHHLAMIVQTGFGVGGFQVLQATSPAGPWTPGPAGQVPDPCRRGTYACYALSGHAELSTADRFWFSWYSPDDVDGFGHIRLGSVAW